VGEAFLCGSSGTNKSSGTLTVTAPAGATVTVSKDGKTKTRTAGADGVVVFRGLQSGTWTLSIMDGDQKNSKSVEIVSDYATSITFFAATIHITYPAGSTCTATDGTTTLTAPDTSGTWDLQVTETGTWTIKLNNGFYESLVLDQSVSDYTVDKWYLYKDGNHYNDLTGGFEKYQSFNAGGSHSLNDADLTITRNAGGSYRIKAVNLIDLTKFTTLLMTGSVVSGSRGGCFLRVFNSSGSEICSSALNNAVDIKSASGKCIVVISAEGSLSDPSCTYSIKKIQAT
jgi:predicted Rdx family selenoprotein